MMRSILPALLLAALPLAAAPAPAPKKPAPPAVAAAPSAAGKQAVPKPKPFHLTLEANPAAPFPFLSKFGKTTLDVYPSGVRAETLWLNAFTRNDTPAVTVENPLARMYTEVPVAQIASVVAKLAPYGNDDFGRNAKLTPPAPGRLGDLDATRYRIVYGPDAWIDVWTTTALPESPALRAVATEFTRGISPATAALLRDIPGMPLQVVINFSHHPVVPILTFKSLTTNVADEASDLKVGRLYGKAPLLDALWK